MSYLCSLISQTKTHLKWHRGSEMSWFNIKRKWSLRSHQRHRALAVYCPLEYIILNYQTSLCHFKIECPVRRDVNKGSLLKTRLLERSWASLRQAAFLPSPLEAFIYLLIPLALYGSGGNDTPAGSTPEAAGLDSRALILHHRTQGSIRPGPGGTWKGKKEKSARKKSDLSRTGYFWSTAPIKGETSLNTGSQSSGPRSGQRVESPGRCLSWICVQQPYSHV